MCLACCKIQMHELRFSTFRLHMTWLSKYIDAGEISTPLRAQLTQSSVRLCVSSQSNLTQSKEGERVGETANVWRISMQFSGH